MGFTLCKKLPQLPTQLDIFFCRNNNLKTLPRLPNTLRVLNCSNNNLTRLPKLPPYIYEIVCDSNKLKELPELPLGIVGIFCNNNQLTRLPKIPGSVKEIQCYSNNIQIYQTIPRHSPLSISIYYDEDKLVSIESIRENASTFSLSRNKVQTIAKLKCIACKIIARDLAARIIQRNCERWLDAPITNDGLVGIRCRIGLREVSGYDDLVPPPQKIILSNY